MINKTNFLLALISGIVAVFLVHFYIKDIEQGIVSEEHMVKAIIVNGCISAGEEIKSELVEERYIPEALRLHQGAQNIDEVVGKYATIDMVPGEQIILSRLRTHEISNSREPNLVEGMRAIMLSLPEDDRLGGVLKPGDRVDVISILRLRDGGEASITVLQDIKVISAGGTKEGPRNYSSGFDSADLSYMGFSPSSYNVVLLVTPEDAQKLALLHEYGKIKLSLRTNEDQTIQDIVQTDMTSILEDVKERKSHGIEVIRRTEVETTRVIEDNIPFSLSKSIMEEIIKKKE